jgi:hypothetical protein
MLPWEELHIFIEGKPFTKRGKGKKRKAPSDPSCTI